MAPLTGLTTQAEMQSQPMEKAQKTYLEIWSTRMKFDHILNSSVLFRLIVVTVSLVVSSPVFIDGLAALLDV
ncbi:MAG: hypothetical protein JRF07_02310 [Deltaproteobacteria bacterium]|jgi:hypothetical protein|nr:hypothetical protein [Deltaproteobacteria bacterium]